MLLVIHQVDAHDDPSTIKDVIEVNDQNVIQKIKSAAEDKSLSAIVEQAIADGKAKRVDFTDVLAEGVDYVPKSTKTKKM